MVELDKDAWRRLYSEVLLFAVRRTRTKDGSQDATQADRAREATQQAFDRFLRARPAGLDTMEAIRTYLVRGVLSALSHGIEQRELRARHEQAAMMESVTVGASAVPSAEVVHIEDFESRRRRERARRILERLRRDLAGDFIALATIDCIERGHAEPAEQARILGRSVEEIYAARKRRKRALEKILVEERGEGSEEKV